MNKYQLPTDGSVVIVDDKIQEALPLIKLLSQRGVASTYYSGTNDNDELPQKPVQKVRLAFFDIQLFPNSDSHTYAQNILQKLDRIIPDDNGPYLLIIWSVLLDVHASTLISEVTANSFSKRPSAVLTLMKSKYFNTETEDSVKNDLLEVIDSSLNKRFIQEDLIAIKKVINDFYSLNSALVPKKNALQNISKELEKNLDKRDVQRLFTTWENHINKISGRIVNLFSSLHESDEFWQDNLRFTMCKMAHAHLGKKFDSAEDNEIIRNAIKTLNHVFISTFESHSFKKDEFLKTAKINKNTVSFFRNENGKKYEIRWLPKSGEYQLYVDGNDPSNSDKPKKIDKIYELSKRGKNDSEKNCIKSIINKYLSILPDINTKLFIDVNISPVDCPGVVYKKVVPSIKRKRELLENYFNSKNTQGDIFDVVLKDFLFIELNVIPFCDHAQEKWIKDKIRLLPGLMFPEQYLGYSKQGDFLYKAVPLIRIKDKCYSLIFDFRLLKSEPINNNRRKPFFKIRKEVMADILSRLSSHASRVGVSFVE
ncbi:MAG: hypothetical protein ACD_79C00184G0002 [uncultured bacterium]|nr:MAG: hypothetical protein ACD_79C00184G0002 [uncultured bacterium]